MKFINLPTLQKHSAAKHEEGVKKYKCEKCNKAYSHSTSLKNHQNSCDELKALEQQKKYHVTNVKNYSWTIKQQNDIDLLIISFIIK